MGNGMLIGAQAQIDAEAAEGERYDQALDAARLQLRNAFVKACEAGDWQSNIDTPYHSINHGPMDRAEPLDGLMLVDATTAGALLDLLHTALSSTDAGLRIAAQAVVIGAAARHADMHAPAGAELLLEGVAS